MKTRTRLSLFCIFILFFTSLLFPRQAVIYKITPKSITTEDLHAIAASNAEMLYIAGKNATLMLSRDGGLNWEAVKNSADNQYVSLYANSDGHVMATGYTFHSGWWDDAPAGTQFSLHMMGTHFGAMWNERTGGRGDSSRVTASGMVYDSGADLDVYGRTKNTGIIQYSESESVGLRVWKNGFDSEDSRIAFYDIEMRLNYSWAVGSLGTIMKSYTHGRAWYPMTSGTKSTILALSFGDIENGWAVTDQGEILTTRDVGDTWSVLKISSGVLRGVHFFDANNGVVVGDAGRVYHTSNGGADWDFITSGTTAQLNDVVMVSATKAWVVGNGGTLFALDLEGSTPPPVDPQTISASFSPPAELNTWQKYTVPLTAESFGLDAATFAAILKNVTKIRFRTELANGSDVGSLDAVRIGSRFFSDFSTSNENWSAEGDGTMNWIDSGTADGNGFLQISDWATGDWHYAVAPPSWSGDLSDLIGQSIEFYFMTNNANSGYQGYIEITNEPVNRMVLTTNRWTIPPGGKASLTLSLTSVLASDLDVSVSSSNGRFSVPSSVTIPAGSKSISFDVTVSADAAKDETGVITAKASGFADQRLTLTVSDADEPDWPYHLWVNAISTDNYPRARAFLTFYQIDPLIALDDFDKNDITVEDMGGVLDVSNLQPLNASHGARLDLVFVLDVTNSMSSKINELISSVTAVRDSAVRVGLDTRYALVTFASGVEQIFDFTSDIAEFRTQLQGLSLLNDGDGRANALEGLIKTLDLDYRSGAHRQAVLVTDSDYYTETSPGTGSTSWTPLGAEAELAVNDIDLIAIAPATSAFTENFKTFQAIAFDLAEGLLQNMRKVATLVSRQMVVDFTLSGLPSDDERILNFKLVHPGGYTMRTHYLTVGSTQIAVLPGDIMARVGTSFDVDVQVSAISDLGLVHFYVTYDKTKLQPTAVVEGDFLKQGGTQTTFVPEIQSDQGRIDISATRLSDSSTGASGSGSLCRITFSVLVPDCGSQIAISDEAFVLKTLDNISLSATKSAATVHPVSSTPGTSALLGDFDKDLDIDTRDFALLATYWKPANTAAGDIGPANGTPPLMTPVPDGVVNYEDLFVFTRMWNWYHSSGSLSKTVPPLVAGLQIEWDHSVKPDEHGRYQSVLRVEGFDAVCMGHLNLWFDTAAMEISSIRGGSVFSEHNVALLIDRESEAGVVDVAFGLLSESAESRLPVRGDLLVLSWKPKHGNAVLSAQDIDLRDHHGQPLVTLKEVSSALETTALPQAYELMQNYPNPFNSGTRISFAVPEPGRVSIHVYDMLGQPVARLFDKHVQPGTHSIAWQGLSDRGMSVSSGTYWVRMQAKEFSQTRMMVYVK